MNKIQAINTTFALTPFYNDLLEDLLISKGKLIENATSRTNEGKVEILPNSILSLEVFRVGVAFLGPNDIVMGAIDDNVLDFLRSREGFGTWLPGNREIPIDHVEGGRGIFGSFACAKVRKFFAPD